MIKTADPFKTRVNRQRALAVIAITVLSLLIPLMFIAGIRDDIDGAKRLMLLFGFAAFAITGLAATMWDGWLAHQTYKKKRLSDGQDSLQPHNTHSWLISMLGASRAVYCMYAVGVVVAIITYTHAGAYYMTLILALALMSIRSRIVHCQRYAAASYENQCQPERFGWPVP